jgi:hypothetical protein
VEGKISQVLRLRKNGSYGYGKPGVVTIEIQMLRLRKALLTLRKAKCCGLGELDVLVTKKTSRRGYFVVGKKSLVLRVSTIKLTEQVNSIS